MRSLTTRDLVAVSKDYAVFATGNQSPLQRLWPRSMLRHDRKQFPHQGLFGKKERKRRQHLLPLSPMWAEKYATPPRARNVLRVIQKEATNPPTLQQAMRRDPPQPPSLGLEVPVKRSDSPCIDLIRLEDQELADSFSRLESFVERNDFSHTPPVAEVTEQLSLAFSRNKSAQMNSYLSDIRYCMQDMRAIFELLASNSQDINARQKLDFSLSFFRQLKKKIFECKKPPSATESSGNMLHLIEAVTSLSQLTAAELNFQFSISVSEKLRTLFPPQNEIGAFIIQRVLYHLMNKSVKHASRTEGDTLNFSMECANSMFYMTITVAKLGFTAAHMDVIFHKGAPAGTGTTLTLYECRKLLRSLGGDMTIKSEGIDKGVFVTINVPCATIFSPTPPTRSLRPKTRWRKKICGSSLLTTTPSLAKCLNVNAPYFNMGRSKRGGIHKKASSYRRSQEKQG